MAKKNKKAETSYNNMLTLEQFKATFPELGLSDAAYKELYEHLSDREVEDAMLYMATGDRTCYIFSAWDAPLSRGAYPSKLPPEVRITGDKEQLRTWLDQNEKNLNAADMAFVLKHIDVIDKSQKSAEDADQNLVNGNERPKKPDLITDAKGYLRLNMPTPRPQSSSQGCWSTVMQMIVDSRGYKNVSQEDIRAYRPNEYKMPTIKKDYKKPPFPDLDHTYNSDSGKVAREMMDAVLKLSPNTMVRSLNLGRYNPSHPVIIGKGITSEEYYANAKELLRQTIEKAIIIDRSPVMIQEPGHFLSIVGIQGDKLLVQDSRKLKGMGDDRLREISLDYFVENTLERNVDGVELFWGSDIMLDKEGKIIGLPDEDTVVDEQGQVHINDVQMENGIFGASMTEGLTVKRFGGKTVPAKGQDDITEDGLFRTDVVYLPKKLNMNGLKKEAERRSPEQDGLLKSNGNLYYEEMQKLKGTSIQEVLDRGIEEAQRIVAEREAQKNLARQQDAERLAQQEEERRQKKEQKKNKKNPDEERKAPVQSESAKQQQTLVSSSTDQMSFPADKEQQNVKPNTEPRREKKRYSELSLESRDSLSFVAKASEKKEEPKNNTPKRRYQSLSFQSTDTISYVAPERENNSQKRRLTYADVMNKETTDKKNSAAGKKVEEHRLMKERENLKSEIKESENSIKRSNTFKK